ncbi:MAG: diguanylate cyclase domain, partial [Mucilaginibacter sp.]|nr:diguanylate cyclase domain [Mucilaginibacter sp.]
AELNIPHDASRVASRLTVSIGAAFVLPTVNRALEGLIQLADEALYSSKEQGRNRVIGALFRKCRIRLNTRAVSWL